MDLNLKGYTGIVTGGSKGIGAAIAKTFAQEGVNVVISARGQEDLERTANEIKQESGAEVTWIAADMTEADDIDRLVDATVSKYKAVDILVNNAGKARPGPFDKLNDDDWYEDYKMKPLNMIRACRAVLPQMRERGRGRIININAIIGRQSNPGFMSSIVNRAACLAFTKALSDEVATDNILVNSVNIGFVETPQWENVWKRLGANMSKDEFFGKMAEQYVPLKRFGQPEEVAGLVAFLASNHASYITGASIDVGGGMGRYI